MPRQSLSTQTPFLKSETGDYFVIKFLEKTSVKIKNRTQNGYKINVYLSGNVENGLPDDDILDSIAKNPTTPVVKVLSASHAINEQLERLAVKDVYERTFLAVLHEKKTDDSGQVVFNNWELIAIIEEQEKLNFITDKEKK